MKAYFALILIDFKLALRNRAVLFFNYLFPLIFFFMFGFFMNAAQGGTIGYVVTMVLSIGIMGNGLWGAGMRAVQEREANILRRFKVTPIGPLPILVASLVTGLVIYLPAATLVMALAHWYYAMPVPAGLLSLLGLVMLGVFAFRSFGLIIASVVNSTQESNVLIQLTYMPMLFLSGSTIPISEFPPWLQVVSQFMPASYLVTGFQGIFFRQESLIHNWQPVVALATTTVLGLFVSTRIFRWEKEEKIKPAAKLWLAAVLLPFIVLGAYEAWSKKHLGETLALLRQVRRSHNVLIRDARVIVGDGSVVEAGGVLIKNGKIAEIYAGRVPDARSVSAEAYEAAGKTVLPGLIDVHVHLGGPGGIYESWAGYDAKKSMNRALAAYLYCGVTTVKSVGDFLDNSLKLRSRVQSGEVLGAEPFICGPLFTTAGGHGEEFFKDAPEVLRRMAEVQFLRKPTSAEEARIQVVELANRGVDGIKAVLEAGAGDVRFTRMDVDILRVIIDEAHRHQLTVVVHTGDAKDVADAVDAGADGIEHGSAREALPDALFATMAAKGVAYDPTLSVVDALTQFGEGKVDLLDRSLVQQVAPPGLLDGTRKAMQGEAPKDAKRRYGGLHFALDTAKDNLVRAERAGVLVVTGSDAGNPLVIHGPTVQRELQLWVEAGIPAGVALEAATRGAARLLRRDDHIGQVKKGYDADLLIVDGNPLKDIAALESVSAVFLKGERIGRSQLLE